MSPMIACHRIHFPAAVLGLAVLVSFTYARADVDGWRLVDADRQEVDMYVPGMSTWRPGYSKLIYDEGGFTGVSYNTQWGVLLGDRPIAILSHSKRNNSFWYTKLTTRISLFMRTAYINAKVLSLKTDASEHGGFKYIKFDIQTPSKIRSCVGFMRQFNGNSEIIYGHYCLPNEGEITFKTISQIIDSITIHGTASEPEGGLETAQETKDTPQVTFRDGRLLVDLQTVSTVVSTVRQKIWIDFLKIASKNKFTYHAAPESKAVSVCASWRWSSGKPDPRIRWAFWKFGVSDPSLARSQSLQRCDKWVDRSKLQCACQVLRINDQLVIDVPAGPISGQGMGEGESGMVPSNTVPKSTISQPCQPDKMIYAGCE